MRIARDMDLVTRFMIAKDIIVCCQHKQTPNLIFMSSNSAVIAFMNMNTANFQIIGVNNYPH